MTTIEGQQQTNRQMSESGEYIPLPPLLVPLQTFREKHAFIFNKLSTNHCRNCVNVNFNTNSYVCEIPNCTKFHTSYKFNDNISKIDIIYCRYDDNCKMKNHQQCRFIHSEQIDRWYKFYLEIKSVDRMNKVIFLEISRCIEKHHTFYKFKLERERQMEREMERQRIEFRERERRDIEKMRISDYNRRRERSRSRERERDKAPSHSHSQPPSKTSHTQQLEIERLNVEIEVAKKKKELMELSKVAESYKTQIDINKMVETAIASRMQSVAYQMPPVPAPLSSALAYQQYFGAGASAGASAGGYQTSYASGGYQYPSEVDSRGYQYSAGVDPRRYQTSYGSNDRY